LEIVAVDIGGTHARFAIAEVEAGRVVRLGEPMTQKVIEHSTFPLAWASFAEHLGRPIPKAAAIAVASPVNPDLIKLTNNPWIIRPPFIKERLNVDAYTLINDFGAIGHAVGQLDSGSYVHLCGPDREFAEPGSITVCGPGTGLGVAQVFRSDGTYRVIPTEGGHQDYAALDEIDDALIRRLRPTYTRVSAERVCAGPGLVHIYQTLAQIEGRPARHLDDKELWALAFEGTDPLAVAALDRFCVCLGGVAGDLALAHSPTGVVIAGGLGLRLKDRLIESGFAQRFVAKGRFQAMMSNIPVKIITHPQPGLFGAAAAFAQEHASQD